MNEQRHYVGLDVSLETTSICVIDEPRIGDFGLEFAGI